MLSTEDEGCFRHSYGTLSGNTGSVPFHDPLPSPLWKTSIQSVFSNIQVAVLASDILASLVFSAQDWHRTKTYLFRYILLQNYHLELEKKLISSKEWMFSERVRATRQRKGGRSHKYLTWYPWETPLWIPTHGGFVPSVWTYGENPQHSDILGRREGFRTGMSFLMMIKY